VKYYPVFLNLKGKKAVIVGGGRIADRKTQTLLKTGARVTIISPSLTWDLQKLEDKKKVVHIKRPYKKGDIRDAFLVVAATSSVRTNSKVARDAPSLINVVDTPSEGNFIAPSIVRRGPLTIAISTEGASPALSKAVRKELEKLYGREFALYLEFVESVREKAMKKIPDNKKREKFLKSLASKKIFNTLRKEGFPAVSKKIQALLNCY
jgi:precorrin-2 dehydrogenase/sirohydrochlorin ferrochelatase